MPAASLSLSSANSLSLSFFLPLCVPEAVQVYYDESECTYGQLLDLFFARVDPTTKNGQGNDRGSQYRTGVYPHGDEQMEEAKKRFEEVGAK